MSGIPPRATKGLFTYYICKGFQICSPLANKRIGWIFRGTILDTNQGGKAVSKGMKAEITRCAKKARKFTQENMRHIKKAIAQGGEGGELG